MRVRCCDALAACPCSVDGGGEVFARSDAAEIIAVATASARHIGGVDDRETGFAWLRFIFCFGGKAARGLTFCHEFLRLKRVEAIGRAKTRVAVQQIGRASCRERV